MEFNPNDFYGKIVGSTMTGDSTMTSEAKTNSVAFPDGTSIKGNSLDYTENRYDKSASSYALYQGLSKLQENINSIDPDSHFLLDHTVVTRDMIDPHFIRDEYAWDISSNWTVVDGTATLVGEDNNNNHLKMSNRIFTGIGYYYLNVHPTRFDSGTIRIYDNLNNLVGEVRTIGETVIELFITNIEVMTLTFVAEDMIVGDIITLDSIHLHKVKDRFRTYLHDKLEEHGLTTDIVDKEQCAVIAANIVDDAVRLLTDTIDTVRDEMLAHISDRGNVHGLVAADLDVATRDHTHVEFNLFGNDLGSMADHIANISNPHETTPNQIGAANVSHIHVPNECGAAPEEHSHIGQYTTVTDYDNLSNRVTNLERYSSVGSASKAATYPYLTLLISDHRYDLLPEIGDINKYVVPPYNILQKPLYLNKPYETLFNSVTYTDYNYYAGRLMCSRTPMTREQDIFKIFNKPGTVNSVTFDTEGVTEVILELNGIVNITGYTLCKVNRLDTDGEFVTAGYPSNIKLYGDGELISEKVLIENFIDTIHFDLGTTASFKQLKIVTTEQVVSTEDNTWDLGIQLHQDEYINLSGIAVNLLNATGIVKDVFAETPIFNHPVGSMTYMYLKDAGDSYEIVTDNLAPDFDNRGVPVSILSEDTNKNGVHPLWGSILASDVDDEYPLANAIVKDGTSAHYRSTVPSNVIIFHSFQDNKPLRKLSGIYLSWSKDMDKYTFIPKGITVNLQGKRMNNGNTIEVDEEVYVEDNFEYIAYQDGVKLNIDLSSVNIFDITDIKIIFNPKTTRENQLIVALQELRILATPWWADPYTGITSDIAMTPIGRVIHTTTNETDSKGNALTEYINIPYANSKVMYIPLNNARETNIDNFIYNPFGTLNIDVECLYLMNNKFVPCPTDKVVITSITVDKIDVDIKTATDTREFIYLIKVVRQW